MRVIESPPFPPQGRRCFAHIGRAFGRYSDVDEFPLMFVLNSRVSNGQVSKALSSLMFILLIAGAMYLKPRTSR
jgi:hypothetical protein